MKEPTPDVVADVLAKIEAAPTPPVVISYKEWRKRLELPLTMQEWNQSQSVRAKMRRLLKGEQ